MHRHFSAIAVIAVALTLLAGGLAVAQDTGSPVADTAACATPLSEAQGSPAAMGIGGMVATPDAMTGSPVALEPCATPIDSSPSVAAEASGDIAGTATTEVEVAFLDIAFGETEITIPADTDVTFTFVNNGALPHNFTIDDPEVFSGDLASSASSEVVVNLPAGTYEFYCSIPGHKQAGMAGTLTVQ